MHMSTDLYMFDAFQYSELAATYTPNNSAQPSPPPPPPSDLKLPRLRRRPVVESLYDVFFNIREDEAEHASTMRILQLDATLRSRGRT